MKKYTPVLIALAAIIIVAFQEGEKIIKVKDLRKEGIHPHHLDTVTDGYLVNDVAVERVLVNPSYEDKDSIQEIYNVHFFKMYKGSLMNYMMGIMNRDEKDDYDKASYKWANDSVLSIMLINSITKNKTKVFHF